MVDRCWLGETNFDYDFTAFNTVPNATAIQINGTRPLSSASAGLGMLRHRGGMLSILHAPRALLCTTLIPTFMAGAPPKTLMIDGLGPTLCPCTVL